VDLVAEITVINPFDFFLEDYAEHFPFTYPEQLLKELTPFLEVSEEGALLKQFLAETDHSQKAIVDFLVGINQRINRAVNYSIRMEQGVQSCEETLEKKLGSCRDSAWLLVQVLRHMGLAARFVSGYLVQLVADVKALDGPSGTDKDFTDLHAWAEVYIPGAGWIGLDATSGLFAGEGHIPLACAADYVSAAPVSGGYLGEAESTFTFSNNVTRIHEDPRVTKPYTDEQWAEIDALGNKVDVLLEKGDVRLTMGGEPTFVSIDNMDAPEWNTEADNELLVSEDEDDTESPATETMKDLTAVEIKLLQQCLNALESDRENDPKYQQVVNYLFDKGWLELGCIIFSQYYDSVWWLANQLSEHHIPDEQIAIYAGSNRSGLLKNGQFKRLPRDEIKRMVRTGELRLVLGTDAASEGLNLQRLGTLINLDLPWNPTRLEQRKGRIQRIGQIRDEVLLYNMRYRDSVEDRVHELLSERLEDIFELFGQVPDILEDAWVDIALGDEQEAQRKIRSIPKRHPFDERYSQVANIDWDSCSKVLDAGDRRKMLMGGW